MKTNRSYEEMLREKFQEIPVPDVDPNWHAMRQMLDKKKRRRFAFWIFSGFILMALIISSAIMLRPLHKQDVALNKNIPEAHQTIFTSAHKHPESLKGVSKADSSLSVARRLVANSTPAIIVASETPGTSGTSGNSGTHGTSGTQGTLETSETSGTSETPATPATSGTFKRRNKI